MSKQKVAVIDFGLGNILSVKRGLERCGATVVVSANAEIILSAGRVILPGVGAFTNGMRELQARNLCSVIYELADRKVPVLGICLGMQMLLNSSEEFQVTQGLGLIPGTVSPIPVEKPDGQFRKIPHIGWASLVPSKHSSSWEGSLLEGVRPGESVYFLHSFMATTVDPSHCNAVCGYDGAEITAVIAHGSVFGCQFHPEKSGETGLKILENFLSV